MPNRLLTLLKRRFIDDRFLFLLISILSLLVLSPIIKNFVNMALVIDVFSTAILISGIYAAARNKVSLWIAIVLAVPMLSSTWIGSVVESRTIYLASDFFSVVFIGFTAVVIFSYILQAQEITADAIYGALVVYLLLGVTWAFVYSLLEILQPGSFELSKVAPQLVEERRFVLFYYSFVTLTTLGYGDITPTSPTAASFAVVEAVIGQIYLAVIIARIVGIQVAQSSKAKRNE